MNDLLAYSETGREIEMNDLAKVEDTPSHEEEAWKQQVIHNKALGNSFYTDCHGPKRLITFFTPIIVLYTRIEVIYLCELRNAESVFRQAYGKLRTRLTNFAEMSHH